MTQPTPSIAEIKVTIHQSERGYEAAATVQVNWPEMSGAVRWNEDFQKCLRDGFSGAVGMLRTEMTRQRVKRRTRKAREVVGAKR